MQTRNTEHNTGGDDPGDACPHCGMTRRALYEEGHMGCAQCYQAFGTEVERALTEIHGKSIHIGKVREARLDL